MRSNLPRAKKISTVQSYSMSLLEERERIGQHMKPSFGSHECGHLHHTRGKNAPLQQTFPSERE